MLKSAVVHQVHQDVLGGHVWRDEVRPVVRGDRIFGNGVASRMELVATIDELTMMDVALRRHREEAVFHLVSESRHGFEEGTDVDEVAPVRINHDA